MNLTHDHVHVLRHALGADSADPGYRNHFQPGGADVNLCRELRDMGLMTSRNFGREMGGETFFATDVAQLLVLGKVIER